MGSIRRLDSAVSDDFILPAFTRIGRASDNDLVLDDARVSQLHATIAWTSQGVWEIRDLGSRNGTFVDGVRVQAGEARTLMPNARVSFGLETAQWMVLGVERPHPEAVELATGKRLIGTANMLSIPANGEGTIDILEESGGSWVLEGGGAVRDACHGEVIDVEGRSYRISLPIPIARTEEIPSTEGHVTEEHLLGSARFTFLVSADLESIELRVEWSGHRWTAHKAYVRALLSLAEARLRDARSERNEHDCGWMYAEDLRTLASYDSVNRLNVEVHRARTELARAGVPGAPAIIERRRGTGQMRLGTKRVEIVRARKP